jgi:hypothetical protein
MRIEGKVKAKYRTGRLKTRPRMQMQRGNQTYLRLLVRQSELGWFF